MQESILFLSEKLMELDKLMLKPCITNREMAFIFGVNHTDGKFYEIKKHLILCGVISFKNRQPSQYGTSYVDVYSVDKDNIARLALTYAMPNLGERLDDCDWRGILGNSLPLKSKDTIKNIESNLSEFSE